MAGLGREPNCRPSSSMIATVVSFGCKLARTDPACFRLSHADVTVPQPLSPLPHDAPRLAAAVRTEMNYLANVHPEKVQELNAAWEKWGAENQVTPLPRDLGVKS